ncbi:DUF4231 domain-containing protein [Nocardia asteroides]|uniref:DUF4231 domain-containing protein n=1 Tax=Nocardia asteroides TaxID=1824 RepID=UPI001E3E1FEB|nr:DUF4231 domain-containing protein [Nocardia asteroides]UGT53347.1 DUF4231 domain-containing protein [Nocardia asteroides]
MEAISPNPSADVVWERVEGQLDYFRSTAKKAKTLYLSTKLVQLVVGAVIPVLAAAEITGWVTAAVAAIPIAAEGAQQLFQWHSNWLRFRAAAEELKTESFLYRAKVGPYENENRREILAERTARISADETAGWVTTNQSALDSAQQ